MHANLKALLIFSLLIAALGCDSKTSGDKSTSKTEKNAEKSGVIKLTAGDQMKFDQTQLKAKAGEKVTLIFTHTGKMKKTAMGHNFVLLKKGTDVKTFAGKAMKAKDTDYIPVGDAAIIAYTKVIGGGESVTITFTAPEKGSYDYICSFPGHYSMMKGKFISE